MILYTYFRSSTSYRVRIACNLKGVDVTHVPVHLLRDGGDQHKAQYRQVNPSGGVPSLQLDTDVITQSLAIIEYLDECYPQPPLLPADSLPRAHAREIAYHIACDIHPLNNLRVLKYLTGTFSITEEQKLQWARGWIEAGLGAVEQLLNRHCSNRRFCIGDSPTLADVCLIPQVFSARRFELDLEKFPAITDIYSHCMQIEAFRAAAPENQVDAE